MAKATLPRKIVRDVERTLQDRIDAVKSKTAAHYEQCRAELTAIAETFGVEESELFTLAGVPAPAEKPKRRRRKKTAKKKGAAKKKLTSRKKTKKQAAKKITKRKKSAVKKRSGGTAEQQVAAILKKKPGASGSEISKATGYADKTIYNTKAWANRPRA